MIVEDRRNVLSNLCLDVKTASRHLLTIQALNHQGSSYFNGWKSKRKERCFKPVQNHYAQAGP